jgi:nitrite reductase (NADH) small subunit
MTISEDEERPWVEVLNLDETPLERMRAVNVDGEDLVILRQGDQYTAVDRWCPHKKGDMAEGRILGKAFKCPLHGFMFSLNNGRGLNCPGFNLSVHEVRVEAGRLSVRLEKPSLRSGVSNTPPQNSWTTAEDKETS